MPSIHRILNLPGFAIKKAYGNSPLYLEVHYKGKKRCGHCQSVKVRIKASYYREINHHRIGHIPTRLRLKVHKFYCHGCQRYSHQRLPGIAKYQRSSELLQREIFFWHNQGVALSHLAKQYHLGKATLERWHLRHCQRECQEMVNAPCPRILGIDEHRFGKKHPFATTFCDLHRHRIYDVAPGRYRQDLTSYLQQLKGKEQVRVICMDLSRSYRSLAKQYFPNAKIVADRFHVIRLVLHQAMQTYRLILPDMKNNRGMLVLLNKPLERLSPNQRLRQQQLFEQYPSIAAIYHFKQSLYRLLMKKTCTAKRCKRLIPILLDKIKQLRHSPFKPLMTLGNTLFEWREEIVRMWRFSKSNGITEGFHRKMKLIQRQAYGFRNSENYRWRVRVLCR